MAITVSSAITIAKRHLRDTTGDSYDSPDIKEAFRFLFEEFMRISHCDDTTNTVATVADTYTVDVSGLTTFLPHRLQRAWISTTFERVEHTNFEHMLQMHDEASTVTTTKKPQWLAFDGTASTTMWLYPTPDDAYTINLRYRQVLPTLSDDTNIPIPDEYVRGCIVWGLVPLMQKAERKLALATPQWAKFEQWAREVGGEIGPSPNVIYLNVNECL